MTRILVVAEHQDGKLNSATPKCVTCAAGIGGAEIDIVVFAADGSAVAAQAARIAGVKRVLQIDDAAFAEPLAATIAPNWLRREGLCMCSVHRRRLARILCRAWQPCSAWATLVT
jgi:electron transfer flavoprotein alpha subunit